MDRTFYSELPTPGEPQSSPRPKGWTECGGASLPTLLQSFGGAGIARRMPFSPIQTNISMDTISVRGAQETACSGRDLASLCQATRHVQDRTGAPGPAERHGCKPEIRAGSSVEANGVRHACPNHSSRLHRSAGKMALPFLRSSDGVLAHRRLCDARPGVNSAWVYSPVLPQRRNQMVSVLLKLIGLAIRRGTLAA